MRQRCNRRAEVLELCLPHAERKADDAFSEWVRLERDRRCTGETVFDTPCNGRLQAAHFIGRRNYRVRFDPDNVHALCEAHHVMVDQHHRLGAKLAWITHLLGDERRDALVRRSNETADRRDVLLEQLTKEAA